MTGRERDEFEIQLMVKHGGKTVPDYTNSRAKLVAKCVVDDDGNRMFSDYDAAALGEKSGALIDLLWEVGARLSGLRDKDMQEMAEDFGGEGGGPSSSTSPNGSAKPSKASSPK
jgi:hypothetical protein